MPALFLVVALFLYLAFVGQAVVSLLRPRLGVLWSWFIAPTVGLALVMTLVTHLNVWGWPVKAFGPELTLGLFIGAAGVLAWRRPVLPWRALTPFLLIACGSLLYFGWPALRFGFNWVSYGNDDMTNYTLAADRFLNHGYYDVPTLADIKGRDYTQIYWFLHALGQIRPGAELLVAWVASTTGLNAHQAFMPTILMLAWLQLFALGALALSRGRHRRMALLAFLLLATSPLFGLGTLYQLIAQVGGLALLLATASLLISTRFITLRKILLTGLIACALGIYYPEVTPFLALGLLLFVGRLIRSGTGQLGPLAGFVIFSAVLTFLLLGTNVFEYLVTLFAQASSLSLSAGEFSLFPWTLVPSYLPMIFGLHTFGEIGRDPLLSLQIAAGFVLAGYALRCVWRSAVRDLPAGYLGLVIIGLGLSLFFKKYDFGLFKLAMYAQPILALCFAQDLSRFLFNQSLNVRRAARWGLAAFVVCTVPAAYNYTHSSLGDKGGGLAEIVDASRVGVKFAPPKDLPYDSICSDINNLVAAKMLMLYTKNIETYFLSRDYATNLSSFRPPAFLCDKSSGGLAMNDTFLLRLFFPENFLQSQVPFYLPPKIVAADNEWLDLGPHDQGRHLFVALRSDLDGFNKSNPDGGWRVDNIYQYKLESLLQNRLVFIHSKLGPQYFLSDRARVAIYQREPDPAMPGTASYHGTGRFNVFEVVNPTPSFRMVVDFTCSSLGAEACQLPEHAAVEGAGKYPLAFVGDGSARVISPPLQPEFLHDNAYLTVDFGREGRPFTTQKTGLMRLYGVAKNLDNRRLVGDTRDISLLTEEQYRALTRPTMISRFPDDLYRYPGLEYSGLSEDGWIAGEAYVKLGPSHPGQTLVFRGLIPAVPKFANHGVDLSLLINGTLSGTVHLMPGEFSLSRPLVEKSDITSVAFHFSDAQKYEFKLDRRRFSALVREIAIKDAAEVSAQAHRSGPSGEAPERSGLDSDGWLDRTAVLKTPVFPGFKVLKIDLEMPGWAPIASNGLKVFLNGRLIQADLVPRGSDQSLYLPIAAGAPAEVRLESATAFVLPKEYRERCFLVKNLSYEEPTRADLFARGWHKSGYAFSIDRADTDGWVDRRVAFRFPATTQYKSAIVDVVRFPAPSNLPLAVSIDGAIAVNHPLGLEQAARIRIPLSAQTETTATLATERSFPLAAPDSRQRSFRITGIDFE